MKLIKSALILILMTPMLSCTDQLCYDHPHYAKVNFTFNDNRDSTLDSYKIILFPIDDGVMELDLLGAQEYILANTKSTALSIRPGRYNIVMFNNDSGQTEFFGADTYQSIYTTGTSLENSAQEGVLMENTTIAEPGMTYVAHQSDCDIDGGEIVLDAVAITKELHIKVNINNLCYAQSFTGKIGNIYSRYNISEESFMGKGNVVKLNNYNCSIKFDENGTDGYLEIEIRILEFVEESVYEAGEPNAYFDIEFRLVDNSIIKFDPYIFTEFVAAHRNSSKTETLIIGGEDDNTGNSYPIIEIPPVIGLGGGSGDGLGADVDSWGESDDLNIPFM